MKTLLIVTGALAAVALLIPDLVTIGLFALIVPGLILAAAPTAFIYLSVMAVARSILPLPPGPLGTFAAFGAALTLGAAVALPFHLLGRLAFERARAPDALPDAPVRLSGHVRLERSDLSTRRAGDALVPACDALCAALLETPGVTAVTITGKRRGGEALPAMTYRLVPAAEAPDSRLAPENPDEIVGDLPGFDRNGGGRDWRAELDRVLARRRAIAAGWALRLAGDERLVASPPTAEPDMDIVVRDEVVDARHQVTVKEVAISDRGGRVLFRRRRVVGQPIMAPFALTPVGAGGIKLRWAVARTTLRDGPRYYDFKPVRLLLGATDLARPAGRVDGVTGMRDALADAVADPARVADDPIFSLVDPWLRTLDWNALGADDLTLLARLIADPRVTEFRALYDGATAQVSATLRDAIVRRLARPDTPVDVVNRLDDMVRAMPAGTFAQATALEEAFVRDPSRRRAAPALVERLADRGAPAAPLLAAILTEDAKVEPWAKRQWVLAAVRRALIRLGPDAAPVLPQVEELVAGGRLTNAWREADDWRFAMLRMGLPPERLRFPDHYSPEERARELARLRDRLARYTLDAALH